MKYLLLITAIVFSGSAIAFDFGNAGAVMKGMDDKERLDNCIKACGQDGRCQAACIAAGKSGNNDQQLQMQTESPQTQPQPQHVPVTDYTCVQFAQRRGLSYAAAMAECTQ